MEALMRKAITTKEAAKLLGVLPPTVLRYAKDGLLNPVTGDWHRDGGKLFYEDEVIVLKEELTLPGMSTKEVADLLDTSQPTVVKYIYNGQLKAQKKMLRGKETYYVLEEDLNEFITHHKVKKIEKAALSIDINGQTVYLYQPFKHVQTGECVRITDINEIGTVTKENGLTFPLTELFKDGYTSALAIEKGDYIRKRGFVTFEFPRPYSIHATCYSILEQLYMYAGPQNMKIDVTADVITVRVRPCHLPVDKINAEHIIYLRQHVRDGSVHARHNGVYLDSDIEHLSFYTDKKTKVKLKEYAVANDMGLEEVLNKAVEVLLNTK